MDLDEQKITSFQTKILNFYKQQGRDLPWRNTSNPYYIHLSEIMLQQTQVSRVINYYQKFIKNFPDLKSLSKAPRYTLLSNWQGLGYNNRVIRLQESAKLILEKYDGKYPQDQKELQSLPGVGSYTSGAILSFAFNITSKVVDTNIRRILIHELNLDETTSIKELEEIAYQVTPSGKAKEWNNALMDYGALELTAKKAKIKPTTKQSKFIGSTRWVRSQIVKQLLEQHEINIKDLETRFHEYNIKEILEKMQKDQLIKIKNNKVYIFEN